MALDRFRNLPADQQAQILETAALFFSEHGYTEASYSELLRRLGMGKSQAYYYFADKADLFITACAASYERYYEEAGRVPLPASASGFWKYVYELTLLGFRFQNSDPVTSRLTQAAVKSEIRFKIADALITSVGSSREQHAKWVALGQQLGAVRTDLHDALLVRLSLEFALFVDGYFGDLAAPVPDSECLRLAEVFTDLSRRMFEPARTKTKKRRNA